MVKTTLFHSALVLRRPKSKILTHLGVNRGVKEVVTSHFLELLLEAILLRPIPLPSTTTIARKYRIVPASEPLGLWGCRRLWRGDRIVQQLQKTLHYIVNEFCLLHGCEKPETSHFPGVQNQKSHGTILSSFYVISKV